MTLTIILKLLKTIIFITLSSDISALLTAKILRESSQNSYWDKTVRKINLKYDADADVWYARGYFWEDIHRIKYGLECLEYGSHAIIRTSDGEVLAIWHDKD